VETGKGWISAGKLQVIGEKSAHRWILIERLAGFFRLALRLLEGVH